jgi:hypothetical protein
MDQQVNTDADPAAAESPAADPAAPPDAPLAMPRQVLEAPRLRLLAQLRARFGAALLPRREG